jgi:nitrite reductase/ring-hydroxylating ferredoxin subunit
MVEVLVCKAEEMADGDVRIVSVDTREAGIYKFNGAYYAYSNLCAHQGGPACEGMRVPKVLAVLNADKTSYRQAYDATDMHFVCPWHGYEYSMTTGECAGDHSLRLHRYPVAERDGSVYVTI